MNCRNIGLARIEKILFPTLFLLIAAALFCTETSGGSPPEKIVRADAGQSVCELEARMIASGLVNVKEVDPDLLVDLKYASHKNFMGADVYGGLRSCYLQPEPANMLKRAHEILKKRRSDLRLLLADGCRPRSVQNRMWRIVKGTPMQRYVAEPSRGSMHNYGAAVDITLADENGRSLDMGTPIDYFGVLAQPAEEMRFLKEGKLTEQQVVDRRLLREVMVEAGFIPLRIEWWHFNAFPNEVVRKKYRIIE